MSDEAMIEAAYILQEEIREHELAFRERDTFRKLLEDADAKLQAVAARRRVAERAFEEACRE